MILLFLACASPNSGPAPEDYGEVCDPEAPSCSHGLECVEGADHTEWLSVDFICSMPCQTDGDCPEGEARCFDNGSHLGQSYGCVENGYCFVPACSNHDPPHRVPGQQATEVWMEEHGLSLAWDFDVGPDPCWGGSLGHGSVATPTFSGQGAGTNR